MRAYPFIVYCVSIKSKLYGISQSHVLAIFVFTANRAKYKCFTVEMNTGMGHTCGGQIENAIPRITVWHHLAC